MEINCKMTYNLPEELISALGITEDTAFETYFEDGAIHIHPLTDDELAEIPVTDMCNRIALCIPANGSDPELLSAKAEEVFGFNRGDGYAFVYNSIPVSDISVQFCNIKPSSVDLSDESESLCLYAECRNPDDDGYERNLEAWLHQIVSMMKTSGYTDDAIRMAQLLYAGSLCDAEYRCDWSDALLRCIDDGKVSFDTLKEAVIHEFGVCIDYNALLIDYYAKG